MTKNKDIILKLKLKLYSKEAIYNTCYHFIDSYYIFLDSKKEGEVEINLKSKKQINSKQTEKIKGDFMNELIFNSTRIAVAKNNKKLREFIVGRALFSAVESKTETKEEDFIKDPLGIAIPWEEKYQKKAKN